MSLLIALLITLTAAVIVRDATPVKLVQCRTVKIHIFATARGGFVARWQESTGDKELTSPNLKTLVEIARVRANQLAREIKPFPPNVVAVVTKETVDLLIRKTTNHGYVSYKFHWNFSPAEKGERSSRSLNTAIGFAEEEAERIYGAVIGIPPITPSEQMEFRAILEKLKLLETDGRPAVRPLEAICDYVFAVNAIEGRCLRTCATYYQAAVPASIPDISVRELKVKIVADKRTTEEIKKRTGNNWNENLEVAARYFEATLLKDLTVEKLRTFRDQVNGCNETKNQRLAYVGMALTWAQKQEPPLYPPNKINPVSKIKELQPTCREVAIYSIEDLRQIVEKCGVLLFPYVALVLFGGFRPSEAAIALWKDISRAARTLSALKTKKNKRRNHRMPSNLDLALDLYRACTGIVCAVPDPAAELNALLRSLNIKAIQDGLRHCFCSYVYRYMTDVLQIPNAKEWIAKWMCNSVADIDKNYLNENVSTEDSIVFMALMPTLPGLLSQAISPDTTKVHVKKTSAELVRRQIADTGTKLDKTAFKEAVAQMAVSVRQDLKKHSIVPRLPRGLPRVANPEKYSALPPFVMPRSDDR